MFLLVMVRERGKFERDGGRVEEACMRGDEWRVCRMEGEWMECVFLDLGIQRHLLQLSFT